jgi:sigma-E factor negative regulatory protein RseC
MSERVTSEEISVHDMLHFTVMEEVGVIVSIHGMTAKVTVPRKSACEGCSAGTCKPSEKTMELEALNPIKATVGQTVRVVMKPYSYLRGSIIVYGIPALALVIGAILGKEVFSKYFRGIDPDVVSAFFGFGACIIFFLFVKIWSNKVEKKHELKPVIEEVIE